MESLFVLGLIAAVFSLITSTYERPTSENTPD